ncbi:hypothetical protein [Thioflavicoccus mobilis]|uniref:hypothetical protein n=1 Tax=Thioflavicoccus mobilis TaxID=80679 RepID=UPI001FDECA25|nr:hypothetical protein [Thioflavicoccus mobilis]
MKKKVDKSGDSEWTVTCSNSNAAIPVASKNLIIEREPKESEMFTAIMELFHAKGGGISPMLGLEVEGITKTSCRYIDPGKYRCGYLVKTNVTSGNPALLFAQAMTAGVPTNGLFTRESATSWKFHGSGS